MSWIPSLATGFLGYLGAKDQASQQAANNALLREQYDYEKSVRAPAVTGAQEALQAGRWVDAQGNEVPAGTAGAVWQSQFQPFVDAQGNQAVGGINISNEYLRNVPRYQQAGLQGLDLTQQLAGFTPFQQQQLAQQYTDAGVQARYDLAAKDINRSADAQARDAALQRGEFGALGTQAARQVEAAERGRTDALNRAATQATQEGWQRAQQEMARQTGLAGTLGAYGASGLSQAGTALGLGSTAAQQGINAPFAPFNAYSASVGAAPQANAPQYQVTKDPLSTGVGLGLQAYNLFRDK